MADKVLVKGLRELQVATTLLQKGLASDIREGLKSAAEPVRREAEISAGSEISGMVRSRVKWQGMRVGVTKSLVYVAPTQRSTRQPGRARPNLAPLLLNKAMLPALAHNAGKVEQEVGDAVDDALRRWEQI